MVMGIVIAFLSDNKCTPMVQGGGGDNNSYQVGGNINAYLWARG